MWASRTADRSAWPRISPGGLTFGWRMIFSENRFPLFGIMRSLIFPLPLAWRTRKGEAMQTLRWLTFVLFGLFAVVGPVQPANSQTRLQTLEIASKTGVHAFAVEFVDNDADRAKGLMYRKELPEGRGMLFDFHRDQEVSFWMQNTYIPLDIIFIRGDGRIQRIAENTEPLSERLIPSGGPVRGVLEVIGGTARKLGIAPGDRVAHPIFSGR